MHKSRDDVIEIELFKDVFKSIDQEFFDSIILIASLFNDNGEFLLITNDYNVYVYGTKICSYLSFEHDQGRPQKVAILNGFEIVQVDSGENFVALLNHDGQVYLASNDLNWKTNETFRLISNDDNHFEMIACGAKYLLLLRQDGMVFKLGDNEYVQSTCGLLSYETMIYIGLENVKQISCGRFHSIALTNTGEIYSWGRNEYGQLGVGDKNERITPTIVKFDTTIDNQIKNIATGENHSLFLVENGQLWGCGSNCDGQLGLGIDKTDNYSGSKMIVNKPIEKPIKIPIEKVKKMACSKFHNFSLAYDGTSYFGCGQIRNKSFWRSPCKLESKSFSAASVNMISFPITFGLTTTIYELEPHYSISTIRLFNNPDNFDVEFIIKGKRIKACKCYLKMESDYYRRMFSGAWKENIEVEIKDYCYNTYYIYLRMLHSGSIRINQQNITELIDLANCYCDGRLMRYCRTFLQNDLNKRTMRTYLSLIIKYELKEMHAKLGQLAIDEVLPKITDNILQNGDDSITKFLDWFFNQQSFLKNEI
ncbi:RCC1 and BTB domain-containing protein 2 [Dermatophagoides farinae]|uniref:RCC1 and BTB domain-containing protein 2 n=1 Tax=Dermatophagoides farinae TaxID=6954 RepID=UPI003F6229F9